MVDVAKRGAAVSVISKPLSSADITSSPPAAENGDSPRTNRREQDHYGFYREQEEQHNYDPLLTVAKAREREDKWLEMLSNWKYWMEKKTIKVKERCRKGIPDSLRGRAWMRMSGAHELLEQNEGCFEKLTQDPDSDIVIHVIDKDLDRTFPTHVLFSKKGCQGQTDLRLVLKAYAMYNKKTGYCQAMAPVAATLLMHMPAEHAFWCLVQICEQYLPGYYSPGLHAFQIDALILKDLLAKYLPNIAQFLDSKLPPTSPNEVNRGLDPVLYCTEWFMSMFSRSLPWPTVLRVWDMFFFEGMKVQFKVALAVLNLIFSRPQTREECPGFFEVTRKMRSIPREVTHEETLIPEILRFRLTTKELKKQHYTQADMHFSEERVRTMQVQARRRSAAPSEYTSEY